MNHLNSTGPTRQQLAAKTRQRQRNAALAAVLLVIVWQQMLGSCTPPTLPKCRIHTSMMTGHTWLQELRMGHELRMHNMFHMDVAMFNGLVSLLHQSGFLPPPRYIDPQEQVAIFLFIVAGNNSNRSTQERFQQSADMVSWCFHGVLKTLLSLQPCYMKLPSKRIPPKISGNPKFSFFTGCVGALDCTHFSAVVPETEADLYWCQKGGALKQNVLGVCGFDMLFQYIHARWEGSAHDGWVLNDALMMRSFSVPDGCTTLQMPAIL